MDAREQSTARQSDYSALNMPNQQTNKQPDIGNNVNTSFNSINHANWAHLVPSTCVPVKHAYKTPFSRRVCPFCLLLLHVQMHVIWYSYSMSARLIRLTISRRLPKKFVFFITIRTLTQAIKSNAIAGTNAPFPISLTRVSKLATTSDVWTDLPAPETCQHPTIIDVQHVLILRMLSDAII